ncbi:hypothetical protein QF117_10595 [Vibrio sp. YMD68]|uniref:hypothetical protein n=1 Tax=Vibrio sp. YMD68 TaxID=3042300 RepID=UPI00249C5A49|nr:hypothetical protein [Vibrio sp. YMD68]WGV98835.1 hypothetical protein QF117_02415 [Vibrio sp. YMD68]WGW01238.1 hypothetical protein QF117_10595 [Vibrio sp. YMD68]
MTSQRKSSRTFKTTLSKIYDAELTLKDVADEVDMSATQAYNAINKWFGRTGNPRGKTRKLFKRIEEITGDRIYTEAA